MQLNNRSLPKPIAACIACVFTICHAVAADVPLDYLKKLESQEAQLEKLEKTEANASPRQSSSLLQSIGTSRSWIGDMQGAIEAFDRFAKATDIKIAQTTESLDVKSEDAISAILKQAKDRQIVILNEAHHVPMHRAFAIRLARELRKLGFEYLACETFSGLATRMQQSYPRLYDGYYLREPLFAEFARDAANDGWKLVAYEMTPPEGSPEEQFWLREMGQANNLFDKLWRLNPKAKAFIYVGYSHGYKAAVDVKGSERYHMGGNLKRLTGLDPLVIDQTEMYSHTTAAAEHPAYRSAVESHPSKAPFVLWDSNGSPAVFGSARGKVDLQVVWPATQYVDGKPTWLETVAERKAIDIPSELIPKAGKRLIYAFHIEDGADALPVGTIVIQADAVTPKLMLPKGTYRFGFEDASPVPESRSGSAIKTN